MDLGTETTAAAAAAFIDFRKNLIKRPLYCFDEFLHDKFPLNDTPFFFFFFFYSGSYINFPDIFPHKKSSHRL